MKDTVQCWQERYAGCYRLWEFKLAEQAQATSSHCEIPPTRCDLWKQDFKLEQSTGDNFH